MYGTGNKKMLNMLILDILKDYSDTEHRLTQQDIIMAFILYMNRLMKNSWKRDFQEKSQMATYTRVFGNNLVRHR